jgi:thioredoxin-related protein
MRNKYTFFNIVITALLIFFTSVSVVNAQQEQNADISDLMPELPVNITEAEQRASYLVLHYWDNYNFADTAFLMKNNLLERGFADFLDVLSFVPADTMNKAVSLLLSKAENERSVFMLFLQLSEKYLYQPGSPFCDEEVFIPFLQYFLQSGLLSESEKIRPEFLLDNVMKNRIGHQANDFEYTLKDESTGTLYDIGIEYTLLFFNDPDCDECSKMTKLLIVSPVVNKLIGEGKLKVLTVYLFDDTDSWVNYSSSVLNSWIYSRDADQKINIESIYNIKHIPTLYLLDKNKKVILKDTTFEKVEDFFNN